MEGRTRDYQQEKRNHLRHTFMLASGAEDQPLSNFAFVRYITDGGFRFSQTITLVGFRIFVLVRRGGRSLM